MTTILSKATFGRGVYTFPEAARILQGIAGDVSTRQLRYWMASGLTPASHIDKEDSEPILSFDDLISLEVVRRLRSEGASLQSVRAVEAALREANPKLDRPFAYKVFFTDGADVWAEVVGQEGHIVIELTTRHRHQYAWRDAIVTFAEEIRFDGPDAHATHWALSPWVEINPAIQFGAPIVTGSRVPVRTLGANLEVGTPEQVADWYGLRLEQVQGVKDYLAIH